MKGYSNVVVHLQAANGQRLGFYILFLSFSFFSQWFGGFLVASCACESEPQSSSIWHWFVNFVFLFCCTFFVWPQIQVGKLTSQGNCNTRSLNAWGIHDDGSTEAGMFGKAEMASLQKPLITCAHLSDRPGLGRVYGCTRSHLLPLVGVSSLLVQSRVPALLIPGGTVSVRTYHPDSGIQEDQIQVEPLPWPQGSTTQDALHRVSKNIV